MNKILFILLFIPILSNAQWSCQNYSLNVTSTGNVGIGTATPYSLLQLYGNKRTANLLSIYNDKDNNKDSSFIITSNGSVIVDDSSYIKIGVNYPVSPAKVTIAGGIPLRLLNKNKVGYTSIKWSAMSSTDTIADYAQIYGGVDDATYGAQKGYLKFTTYSNGAMNSNVMMLNHQGKLYFGDTTTTDVTIIKPKYVGIGITEPTSHLHLSGSGSSTSLVNITNDKDATKDSTFFINKLGCVGIGNAAPLYPLHIVSINASYGIYATSTTSGSVIYGEYNGASLNSGVKGVAAGSSGIGVMGEATSTGTGGYFVSNGAGTALYSTSSTGFSLVTGTGDIVTDSARRHDKGTTLSPAEKYSFPTNKVWKGTIDIDSLGFTLATYDFRCDADGTPYLGTCVWKRWSTITYMAVGSSAGYFNLSDDGSGAAITNNTTYTAKLTFILRDKQ